MKFHRAGRSALAVLAFSLLMNTSFGQRLTEKTSIGSSKSGVANVVSAPTSAVEPVVFDGQNITCADLNALHVNGSGDARFSQIITNNELKLNFGDPNGTFPFTTGGGRVVVGPQDATRAVTITSSSNPGTVSGWSSQLPITAVNVKVGNTSYVYPYKPFRMSDTNLATGDPRGISHVTFCFGEPTGPTAAQASITGRVVDSNGQGISKAQMVLITGSTGEARITMSNSFGYYTFENLEIDELYVLNVSHKRFTFAEKQKTLGVLDNMTDVDFVGLVNQ